MIGAMDDSIYCWTRPPSSYMRPSVALSRAAGRESGSGDLEETGCGKRWADVEGVELATEVAGAGSSLWICCALGTGKDEVARKREAGAVVDG